MTGGAELLPDTLLSIVGTAIASAALWAIVRMLSQDMARGLVLLILLPCIGVALWLPEALASHLWRAAMQGACLAPLALIAPLQARAHLEPGLKRAAAGLGAGRRARLRLVWWPAYGSRIMLGAALALLAGTGIQATRDLHSASVIATDRR